MCAVYRVGLELAERIPIRG